MNETSKLTTEQIAAILQSNPELAAEFNAMAARGVAIEAPEMAAFRDKLRAAANTNEMQEGPTVMPPKEKPGRKGAKAVQNKIPTLQVMIDQAVPVPPPPPESKAESATDSGKIKSDDEGSVRPPNGLPADCPVKVLGDDASAIYVLDVASRLIVIPSRDLVRSKIIKIFGDQIGWLERNYPRRKKIITRDRPMGEWITSGWHPELVAEDLTVAASRKGFLQVGGRVRQLGSWSGENGELVLHCGDVVLVEHRVYPPGIIGGYIYPAKPALVRPWHLPVPVSVVNPVRRLRTMLNTWNWVNGELDADLLLGWIACAMIGGALPWRPNVWLSGGSGTGKSTLRRLIDALLGGRLIAANDSTEAGIRDRLELSTLPIAIDEHEAEADNSRGEKIIRQARSATSGAMVLRGSANHQAVEFTLQSAYLFSAIVIPPLQPQDRNRFAILSLGKLKQDDIPNINPKELRDEGQKLLRRLVDGWSEWEYVSGAFRNALLAEKVGARGADLYSQLLTGAEILLRDDRSDLQSYAREVALMLVDRGIGEIEDGAGDEWRCLARLLTTLLPLDSASFRRPTKEWLARKWFNAPFDNDSHDPDRILSGYGLGFQYEEHAGRLIPWLMVANHHAELEKIFRGTHWATYSSADGPWKQSLERLPGAAPAKNTKWFRGQGNSRFTVIPIPGVCFTEEEEATWRQRIQPKQSALRM